MCSTGFIKESIQRSRRQGGSLTLFIALIVFPLLFGLFSLSLDVSNYFTVSQRAQKVADDAVLYSYRFLPSVNDARSALQMYVSQYANNLGVADPANPTQIEVDNDFVNLTYRARFPLTFAGLLGLDVSLPVIVRASARSTPLDLFLAMDSSSYLAPNLMGNEIWGAVSDWPAAHFFANELQFYRTLAGETSSNPDDLINPAIVTQQCFNPAFSAEKQAAIKIYDYLATFQLNHLGVGFFPGYGRALDISREVVKSGVRPGGQGEADFNDFYGSVYHKDVYCAAAAEKELNHQAYRFPGHSSTIGSTVNCPQSAAQSMVSPITREIDPDYKPCMQARQVIWARSINPTPDQNFPAVLAEMSGALMGTASRESEAGRTGLDNSVSKVGVILAGDVPRYRVNEYNEENDTYTLFNFRFPEQALRDRISQQLEGIISDTERFGKNYSIYYVLFRRPDIDLDTWSAEINELQEYFAQFNNRQLEKGSFNIKLFAADDPDKLSQDLISLILLQKKTTMLAR